jgi:hypothetical protein
MRVKTDTGAFVPAAILAAVLTWVTVGDGSPPKPLTNAGATPAPVAVRPMQPDPQAPTFHRVGEEAPRDPDPSLAPRPQAEILQAVSSPDALVLQALRGAITYLLLFVPGHLALRRLDIGGRWPYAGLGSACALITVASQTPLQGWRNLIVGGHVSYYLAIPLLAGLIMGFIYHWRAGLEADGDDPALLEAVLSRAAAERHPEGAAGGVSADGALVDTGQAEYFDGPLQVRTTFPVALVAALLSSGLFGLVGMAFGVPGEVRGWLASGQSLPMTNIVALAIQSQLHVLLLMGVLAPVPFAALVMLGHIVLRAYDKISYRAYLAMGATAPLLLMLVLGPLGVFLALRAAVPMAIAMCVYRNMAGLEPKRVREDIVVRDRRDLVGEGHARRRYGRIIQG